jgi:hypothetical protein
LDSLGWTWDVVAGRDGQMDPEKEPKKRFLEKHDPAQTLPIGGDQGLAQEGHGNAAAERRCRHRGDWWPYFVGGDRA